MARGVRRIVRRVITMIAIAASTSTPAAASPRREGGIFSIGVGGGAFFDTSRCTGCGTSPAAGGQLGFGWLFGGSERIAVLAQGSFDETWRASTHVLHTVLAGGIRYWPTERWSLSVGGGVTAQSSSNEDIIVGGGPGAIITTGFDVHHWLRTAAVVRAIVVVGDYDTGGGVQLGVVLAIDGFAIGRTDPNPPPAI